MRESQRLSLRFMSGSFCFHDVCKQRIYTVKLKRTVQVPVTQCVGKYCGH